MKDEAWNFDSLPKWRRRFSRAWRALKGQTWIYLQFHCFSCNSTYVAEVNEEWAWPLIGRCKCKNPMSLKSCTWNRAPVFPTQSQRQSVASVHHAKTGDNLTLQEWREMEQGQGYGSKWWETETVEVILNRAAVRKEHQVHQYEGEA